MTFIVGKNDFGMREIYNTNRHVTKKGYFGRFKIWLNYNANPNNKKNGPSSSEPTAKVSWLRCFARYWLDFGAKMQGNFAKNPLEKVSSWLKIVNSLKNNWVTKLSPWAHCWSFLLIWLILTVFIFWTS